MKPNNTEGVTLDDLGKKIDLLAKAMNDSVEQQKKDRKAFTSKFNFVEDRLAVVEREAHKKSLIIAGIAPLKDESLLNITASIGQALGIQIQAYDLDDIWRTGKEKELIKVIFTRAILKREIVAAIRTKKGLTTKEIGLPGETSIYINEDLPYIVRRVWKKARSLKKNHVIAEAWVSEGRVLVKAKEEDRATICTTQRHLFDLIGSDKADLISSEEEESEEEQQKPTKKRPRKKKQR